MLLAYLVELRFLQVVPLELGVQIIQGLHPDVVKVADLGELRGVGTQRWGRAQKHL